MRKITMSSSAVVAAFLMVGCGSEATTSTNNTPEITNAKKSIGYYVDAEVAGVHYKCGSFEGNTTKDGAFDYELAKECTFSLGDVKLREVNASMLSDKNMTILEDNPEVARMLQSMDRDGNASNGIDIPKEAHTILDESNIDKVPTDDAVLGDLISELHSKAKDFNGTVISAVKVEEHLNETRERLRANGQRTQHGLPTNSEDNQGQENNQSENQNANENQNGMNSEDNQNTHQNVNEGTQGQENNQSETQNANENQNGMNSEDNQNTHQNVNEGTQGQENNQSETQNANENQNGMSSEQNTTNIKKSTGYYVDAEVAGVHYKCGTFEGNTTADGAFDYELDKDCIFSLGDVKLREINASMLSDKNMTILEDNPEVARMLQSMDRDGNASNGIDIPKEAHTILRESNIDKVPTDDAVLGELISKLHSKAKDFNGTVISEAKVVEHLNETRERLSVNGQRTQHGLPSTNSEENNQSETQNANENQNANEEQNGTKSEVNQGQEDNQSETQNANENQNANEEQNGTKSEVNQGQEDNQSETQNANENQNANEEQSGTKSEVNQGQEDNQNETQNANENQNGINSEQNITNIKKSTGYYVDAEVAGVHYKCGTFEGNTTADGAFDYELDKDCIFSLGDVKLREVNASVLSDRNMTILEDNLEVARMLQSMDRDGNASNGIDIPKEAHSVLKEYNKEYNINKVPTEDGILHDILFELKIKREDFNGTVISMTKVEEHLNETREHLRHNGQKTQHGFLEDNNMTRIQNHIASNNREDMQGEEQNFGNDINASKFNTEQNSTVDYRNNMNDEQQNSQNSSTRLENDSDQNNRREK